MEGLVEGSWGPEGRQTTQLSASYISPFLPPLPHTRGLLCLQALPLPSCPCAMGPDTSYFSTSTPGTISRVRGRATSGRQVVWGRAAAGGQV